MSDASLVSFIDDSDSSKDWDNYFDFYAPSAWKPTTDDTRAMLDTYTDINPTNGATVTFGVTFSGTGFVAYGSWTCADFGNQDCYCQDLPDNQPATKFTAQTASADRSALFTVRNLQDTKHTAKVSCTGFSYLLIDFATVTITTSTAISKGRSRLSIRNDASKSINYEGTWKPVDADWKWYDGRLMQTATPNSSLNFTFMGTDIHAIGFWPRGVTSTISLSTVIDDKAAVSAQFTATNGDFKLPYYTFFKQTSLAPMKEGSDQHTINMTVENVPENQPFFFSQFIFIPSISSILEIDNFDQSLLTPGSNSSGAAGTGTNSTTSDSTSNGSDTSSGSQHSSNLGVIIGSIAGAIALLTLIAGGLFLVRRRRKRSSRSAYQGLQEEPEMNLYRRSSQKLIPPSSPSEDSFDLSRKPTAASHVSRGSYTPVSSDRLPTRMSSADVDISDDFEADFRAAAEVQPYTGTISSTR